MKKNTKEMKSNKGITLVALVITIIVLLILAGVSITLLTGENGILTKATIASEDTKNQGALEKVKIAVIGSYGTNGMIDKNELENNLKDIENIDKSTVKNELPMTIIVDNIQITIYENGTVEIESGKLPSTDNTKPYFPNNSFLKRLGTNLDTGLVIEDDNGNSYVWIEVPKNIFINATSNIDYENIEKDMQTYAAEYRISGWEDNWYDGCGLTQSNYNNIKNEIFSSIYNNGGFWIGQYELGTETLRSNKNETLTKPITKKGVYPYNFITVSQAQILASQIALEDYNTSLMLGIQWDLIMKYIEVKGVKSQQQIKLDSTEWGNYLNSMFDIKNGKYSKDFGKTYIDVFKIYTKPKSESILVTTGAEKRNSILNIYDLAGNIFEWTLEKSIYSDSPASARGGSCYYNGDEYSVCERGKGNINFCDSITGARVIIY